MKSRHVRIAVRAASLGDDLRAAPHNARTLGFDGIQLDAHGTAMKVTDLSGSGRRELLRMFAAHDQQLVGLRVDLGRGGLGLGTDVDQTLEKLGRVLETAAQLSAPLVCVDVGLLPVPARVEQIKPVVTQDQAGIILVPSASAATERPAESFAASPAPKPAWVGQVDAALRDLGKLADRYSVIVALRSELSSLAGLERALAAASCPWFGIDVDPPAILVDEWSRTEFFSRLGAQIRHVSGRDAIAGAGQRSRAAVLGSGTTDWGDLLSDLESASYGGWVSVDTTKLPDRIASAQAARKRLAALLEKK